MGLRGPGLTQGGLVTKQPELVFTQWSAHRWNRVNGDAGLGPKAGLETQGSLDGTVCHPYPFQMPPHSYFKTLWSQKALLFSTD